MGHLSSFVYRGNTVMLDMTEHKCVYCASGTIAAVTELHSVCDVSCC